MVTFLVVLIYLLCPTCSIGQNTDKENKFYIIADNVEDSLFCVSYYPYYDFNNDSEIYGVGVPEKMITGKCMSIEEIFMEVKNELLECHNLFEKRQVVAITLMIDRTGKVRGGLCQNDEKWNIEVNKYAFNLLRAYEYTPAYNRGKPINFCVTFIAKIP